MLFLMEYKFSASSKFFEAEAWDLVQRLRKEIKNNKVQDPKERRPQLKHGLRFRSLLKLFTDSCTHGHTHTQQKCLSLS